MRNFMEERTAQIIAEELREVVGRIHIDPRILELYMQNPLLDLWLKNAIKANSKSPYTRPIKDADR